jgi:hypothetical protein
VAEVVTMPISVVASDRDIKHNVSFSVFEVMKTKRQRDRKTER